MNKEKIFFVKTPTRLNHYGKVNEKHSNVNVCSHAAYLLPEHTFHALPGTPSSLPINHMNLFRAFLHLDLVTVFG